MPRLAERQGEFAAALLDLAERQWDRFAMRFSNAPAGLDASATISVEHPLQVPDALLGHA